MAPRPPQLNLSSGPPRYRCVECSHPVSSLFTIYSKDNVRLTQCVSPRILFPLSPFPFPLSRFPQLFSIESASFIRNSHENRLRIDIFACFVFVVIVVV